MSSAKWRPLCLGLDALSILYNTLSAIRAVMLLPQCHWNSLEQYVWKSRNWLYHHSKSQHNKPWAHLNHRNWMTHLCVRTLGNYWFRYWLVSWPVPRQFLNRCWYIVNLILEDNKWNSDQNETNFKQEHGLVNVACMMVVILYSPQCVDGIYCRPISKNYNNPLPVNIASDDAAKRT